MEQPLGPNPNHDPNPPEPSLWGVLTNFLPTPKRGREP